MATDHDPLPFTTVLDADEAEFLRQEIDVRQAYAQAGVGVSKGAVVMDVGANVGCFTRWALRQGAARVLAVEPLPPVVRALRGNVRGWPPDVRRRVVVLPVAVTDADGAADFAFVATAPGESTRHVAERAAQAARLKQAASDAGLGALAAGAPGTGGGGGEEEDGDTGHRVFRCATRRLSSLLRVAAEPVLHLLKLDCEGDELAALQSVDDADWPRVRQVVAEVHDVDGRLAAVVSLLRRHFGRVVSQQQSSCVADDGYLSFVPSALALHYVYATEPLAAVS